MLWRPSAIRRLLAAAAAIGTIAIAPASATEVIDLTIDFAKIVDVGGQAHTVVIGNPGIADVTVGDEDRLVLTGKTAGTTNLIVLDKAGAEMLNATLRVSSDIQQLTTIFYGSQRQTFSCSPVCEQVISVGDNKQKFDDATAQITTRQQFSQGQ